MLLHASGNGVQAHQVLQACGISVNINGSCLLRCKSGVYFIQCLLRCLLFGSGVYIYSHYYAVLCSVWSDFGLCVCQSLPPSNHTHFLSLLPALSLSPGNSGVGKSSLIARLCEGGFRAVLPTVGLDFSTKTLRLGRERVVFQLWDTAGQERWAGLGWMSGGRGEGPV